MRAKTKRAREMASFSWRGVARCDAVCHGGVAAVGARARVFLGDDCVGAYDGGIWWCDCVCVRQRVCDS